MDLSLFTNRIINEGDDLNYKTLGDFLLTLNSIVGKTAFNNESFSSKMPRLSAASDENNNKKLDEDELAKAIGMFKDNGAKQFEIQQFFKLFGLFISFKKFFTKNRLKENFSPNDIDTAITLIDGKMEIVDPNSLKAVKNEINDDSDDDSDDDSNDDSDDDSEGKNASASTDTKPDYLFIRDKNNFKPNNNNKQIISLNNFLTLVSKNPGYFNHFKNNNDDDFGFGKYSKDKISLIGTFNDIYEHPEKYLTANQIASAEINTNLGNLKGVTALKSKIENGTQIETGTNPKNPEMDFTPEDKKTLSRVMGRDYSESSSKSGIFGVAAPSLVAGIGSEEEPEKGVNDFFGKFDEAFTKKIEEYTGKIKSNLDIINKNKKDRKSEGKINFNNEAINVFNKVIEENFKDKIAGFKNNIKKDWNELGAVFKPGDSRADNVANLINNREKELTDFYGKTKRKLENDVNDLTSKYYSEPHAAKRISIAHKVHTKYLNFIRDIEEKFEEFRKTAEIYIDDTNRLVKKANIQTDKRNAKNNLIGLPGKYKREDFESAKKLLTENLNGRSTESKLAIVLLYNIVNNLSGEIKSKDLLNLINKGSNNFKVYSPENIKEQNLDANKYGFDKLYDLTTLNSYTVPRSLLNNILGNEKVNFVFENPEIFKFIKDNENFKNAYNEFIEGINENIPFTPEAKNKGESGKTQLNKNNLAQTNIGYITKAESAKKLSDLNFLTAEAKSYKDLGKLAQLCKQNRVVVSGDSGIYTVKKSAFEASKDAIDNPNKPVPTEQEKNDNQNSQAENNNTVKQTSQLNPLDAKPQLDELTQEVKKLNTTIKDLSNEEKRNIMSYRDKIQNALNKRNESDFNEGIDGLWNYINNIKKKHNTVLESAEENNSQNAFDKILNILKKLKLKKINITQNNNGIQQNQPTQQPNNQQPTQQAVPQQANSTVTTAAADSTYGNGYNYKPKRIREIIYKKGDYTVKTKEEI